MNKIVVVFNFLIVALYTTASTVWIERYFKDNDVVSLLCASFFFIVAYVKAGKVFSS